MTGQSTFQTMTGVFDKFTADVETQCNPTQDVFQVAAGEIVVDKDVQNLVQEVKRQQVLSNANWPETMPKVNLRLVDSTKQVIISDLKWVTTTNSFEMLLPSSQMTNQQFYIAIFQRDCAWYAMVRHSPLFVSVTIPLTNCNQNMLVPDASLKKFEIKMN